MLKLSFLKNNGSQAYTLQQEFEVVSEESNHLKEKGLKLAILGFSSK